MPALVPRTKKLIGVFFILVWLPVYALLAKRVGVAIFPDAGSFLSFVYYAITGTARIIPIGLMLPWMHREPGHGRKI
jgi:hypothetical protein